MFAIRPFHDDDRPALRDIYLASRLQAFPWVSRAEFSLEDFDADIEGENLFVATVNTLPVGFISLYEPDNFIHHLYVDPDSTGRGVGSALLNASIQRLGYPIRLKCLVENQRAVQFYQQRGWQVKGEGDDTHGPFYEMELRGHA